jgi:translation initiation factor 2 beta subunit (eIF-2beta)/eIF-5
LSARSQFGRFTASSLYCKACGRAMPVRERLLLVLPEKELYEYLCTACGAAVGAREVSAAEQIMRREAKGSPGPQVRIL